MALLLSACGENPKSTSTRGLARIMCEESFQSVLEQEIAVFEYLYPEASIMPEYINEHDALDSLFQKKVDVIIISHDLTDDQKKSLKKLGRGHRTKMIAVDAVAVIVNKQNDIDELSMDDLRDIFTGKVKRWGEVSPTKLKNDSIKVIFDQNRSGVVHYIKDTFNGGNDLPIQFYAQGSSQAVFDAVEKTRNAIGVIGVSWITSDMKSTATTVEEKYAQLQENTPPQETHFTDRIKVLGVRNDDKIKDYKPYQAYIYDGSYPLTREIFAIDASPLGTHDHDFFVFLTGSIGQKIILQTGISPASVPIRIVNVGGGN